MGKVMLTLFSLFSPILVGGLVILVTVYICKKMTVTALEHAGMMVLVEAHTSRAESDSGALLVSLNPTVHLTRVVLTRNGSKERLTHP